MDHTTVFGMQGGLLVVMGVVILFAFGRYRQQYTDASALWLAAGYILSGIGLGSLALERDFPSTAVLYPVGSGLFLLFSAFISRAFARTTGMRDLFYPLLAVDAVTTAAFTYWRPTGIALPLCAALAATVLYGSAAMPLLPSKDPLIRPALRTISALIVLQIGITFARLVAWRVAGTHSWFPGMNLLTSAGVALSYLWMNHLRWSAKLERSAMTDPLTGLSNRRAVELFGVRDLEIATRKHAPSSALMLDLDLFKQVNDRLGHSAGDASLCAVANALAATIRPDDMAARLGGDEFFLLLPGTDAREAASIAARVQAAIGAIRLTAPSGEIFTVSASIGSATLTSEHVTLHDLQHVSDAALYREKQRKRSQREFLALETLPGENGIRPTAQ